MNIDDIKKAYGEHYEDNVDLIDNDGWIRICNKTSIKMGRYLYFNEDDFDSRVESLPDMFKSYARPKSLATIQAVIPNSLINDIKVLLFKLLITFLK